jgi:hypothetical protein
MNRGAKIIVLAISFLLVASILPNAVTAGVAEVKPSINVEEMQEWGRQLSDPSMCPRTAGTIKGENAARWMADKFESFGLETWIERSYFNGFFYHGWELEILSPVQEEIICYPWKNTLFGDFDDVELVDVGFGYPQDYMGKDVEGKIVLVDMQTLFLNLIRAQLGRPINKITGMEILHGCKAAIMNAQKHGAAGLIEYYSAWPGNTLFSSFCAEPSDFKGHPLPVLLVGADDGLYLKKLCSQGPVKIKYLLEGVSHPSSAPIICAKLPGKTDDVILISNHPAIPLAGGMGTMCATVELELARYFSQLPLEERDKTMIFVLEETFWDVGCNHSMLTFARNHPEIIERVAYHLHWSACPDFLTPTLWAGVGARLSHSFPPWLPLPEKLFFFDHSPLQVPFCSLNPSLAAAFSKNRLQTFAWEKSLGPNILFIPAPFVGMCHMCLYNKYGVPTITICTQLSWRACSTEDTWGRYPQSFLYGFVKMWTGIVEDLNSISGDTIRKAEITSPIKPITGHNTLFGCATYFPEEPVYEPPDDWTYKPEPGRPLLVGGYYTKLSWKPSPYDSFTPTSGRVAPEHEFESK